MADPEPRLTVDFSNAEDGVIFARVERASAPLAEGATVTLTDAANECDGTVERVDDGLVFVRPDWTTWRDAPLEAPPLIVTFSEAFREAQIVKAKVTVISSGGGVATQSAGPFPKVPVA